jgi:hypothetical protein
VRVNLSARIGTSSPSAKLLIVQHPRSGSPLCIAVKERVACKVDRQDSQLAACRDGADCSERQHPTCGVAKAYDEHFRRVRKMAKSDY